MITMKTAPFNRCIECTDVITNPVCPGCLAKEMQVMVSEHNEALAMQITAPHIPGGETMCISCGDSMNLCAHCFSKDVYLFLEHHNEQIAEEFMRRFDFELRQEFY